MHRDAALGWRPSNVGIYDIVDSALCDTVHAGDPLQPSKSALRRQRDRTVTLCKARVGPSVGEPVDPVCGTSNMGRLQAKVDILSSFIQ